MQTELFSPEARRSVWLQFNLFSIMTTTETRAAILGMPAHLSLALLVVVVPRRHRRPVRRRRRVQVRRRHQPQRRRLRHRLHRRLVPQPADSWQHSRSMRVQGQTVLDASGNGNTGTLEGATRVAAGKSGGALNFDGSGDLVRVNSSNSLNLSSGMTLEAWVRPTTSQTNWRAIVHRESVAYFLHASHEGGDLRPAAGGSFGGKDAVAVLASSALTLNTWTHLASTYDGTTLRLYVNGTLAGSRPVNGSIETSSDPLWIGGNKQWGENFQGQIDDVRIYNRALSAAEILADKDKPVGSSSGGTLPSSSPVSDLPTIDESIAADSGALSAPFIATNGYVSQPSETSLSAGGRAVYKFTVPEHGEYAVIFVVDTHTGNSLYLNVDADPADPIMIWDVEVTQGFETRVASWRGGGSAGSNQFVPKYFLLSPGQHQLIIRGREANTRFKTIRIVKRPAPPNDLVIP